MFQETGYLTDLISLELTPAVTLVIASFARKVCFPFTVAMINSKAIRMKKAGLA